MKRWEIISECANAVKACYNHYSDIPMNNGKLIALTVFLDSNFPDTIKTTQYQETANKYIEYVDSQKE